jgi:DNA-binding NtrC family response regulator
VAAASPAVAVDSLAPLPVPAFPSSAVVAPAGNGVGAVNGAADGPLPPLEEVEKQHILYALERTSGNRVQAAKHLGISERTLRNKLALYREQGVPIVGDD